MSLYKDCVERPAELASQEWAAWKAFCNQLAIVTKSGGAADKPKYKPLIDAARLWAERLASLRRTQSDKTANKALAMALRPDAAESIEAMFAEKEKGGV